MALPAAAATRTLPLAEQTALDGDDDAGAAAVEVEEAPLDVQAILRAAARGRHLDEQQFLRIAWCESRWNPAARGPAGAAGLFQFAPVTWPWASAGAGHGGASPYDPVANAESAAWLMATRGTGAWGCQ